MAFIGSRCDNETNIPPQVSHSREFFEDNTRGKRISSPGGHSSLDVASPFQVLSCPSSTLSIYFLVRLRDILTRRHRPTGHVDLRCASACEEIDLQVEVSVKKGTKGMK
jgi:hypothetical protein